MYVKIIFVCLFSFHSYQVMDRFHERFSVFIVTKSWTDFMNDFYDLGKIGINPIKGEGIKKAPTNPNRYIFRNDKTCHSCIAWLNKFQNYINHVAPPCVLLTSLFLRNQQCWLCWRIKKKRIVFCMIFDSFDSY